MKFDSLKTKIVVYFMGLFTIFLLLFSISFYYYFNQNTKNTLKNELSKLAFETEERLEKNEKINNQYIKLIPNSKKIQNNFFIKDLGEKLEVTFLLPFKNKLIVVTKIVDDKSEDIVDIMLVSEPILLLLLFFAIIKLTNKIFYPIEEITSISKKISINNFDTTIPNKYKEKEIKELIDSFNNMIKRIQEGVNNLEKFNSDISHELKTPLTIIKGEINITLKKIRQPKEYISSMNVILEEIEEMTKITDNLLLLTKYTKDNITQTFKTFNIDILLLQIIEKYNSLANQKNIKIDIIKLENIEIYANEILFYHMLSNLIDNAIKYSNQNNSIKIELYKQENIYFIIEDKGIGIDKKHLDKITHKFYRVDESRNKTIKGFGLGLSIVQKTIELHKAKLQIYSEINEGTKIILTF